MASSGKLPTTVRDDQGKPLLSWRVKLLPFLEDQALYEQIHLDEPWDSPHNRQFLNRVPAAYQSPSGPPAAGKTRLVALAGEGTVFPAQEELTFANIRDGTSNTLMFVQVTPEHAVEWTRPADLEFDPQQPFAKIQSISGSFLAAFCDGSCRMLPTSMGEETMRALATRAGGEVIEYEKLR